MKTIKKNLLLIIILLLAIFTANAQKGKSKTLKIGDKAPPLVHIQKWIKGKPVPAFEKGKVYLVDISLIACPGCVSIIPHLKEIANKYRGKVMVVTVYVAKNTKPEFLEKFVERMGLNYTIAMDMPNNTTNDAWGVWGYPTTFIVNQEGRIVSFGHSEKELESVLETGGVSKELINEISLSQNDRKNTLQKLNKRLSDIFKDEGYAGKLRVIDSILPHVNNELKYDPRSLSLIMSKYEALLHLNDSIGADKCLKEQIKNTPEGSWYRLVSFFMNYVPTTTRTQLLPFNFQRFLEICNNAAKDSKGAFKSLARYYQARVIYWYAPEKNREASMEILNKAEKEDPNQPDLFMSAREEIEKHYQQYQQASDDWEKLQNLITENMHVALKAHEKRGYSAYILDKEKLSRKILARAAAFWDKYKYIGDKRRLKAFNIYTQAHRYNLIHWVDTSRITAELASKIDEIYQQRKEYYRQGEAQGKKIATGPPLFRMFPYDLKAEAEWKRKRNEMAKHELQWAVSIDYKEKIDWELFVSDWGQAYSGWNILPSRDERPNIMVSGIEDDYWKLLAVHYWEALWIRFNEHVDKYACLPEIADRALDFLGATVIAHHSEELVKTYWKYILDTYSDPKHPLTGKAGIQALIKQAQKQVDSWEESSGEKALDLAPFTSLDGRIVDLSKLKGKVVIVDFWATWCKPCITTMPHLKAIYNKYHDKGLEIISVSLDGKNMDVKIKEVIKKQCLLWPQRYEGKGMNDPLARLFGIGSLPTIWLLDKSGKIVDRNARGERLESLIKKYLGLK